MIDMSGRTMRLAAGSRRHDSCRSRTRRISSERRHARERQRHAPVIAARRRPDVSPAAPRATAQSLSFVDVLTEPVTATIRDESSVRLRARPRGFERLLCILTTNSGLRRKPHGCVDHGCRRPFSKAERTKSWLSRCRLIATKRSSCASVRVDRNPAGTPGFARDGARPAPSVARRAPVPPQR